jgi:purine-binding chemotaxis protein CheW
VSITGTFASPMDSSSGENIQLCVFRVGSEEYVLDLKRIEEILPLPTLTTLPLAPAVIEGVINLRGTVLPVIDARKRLGTFGVVTSVRSENPKKNQERLMICKIGRRRVGLIVDAVTNVLRVSRSSLRPTPAVSQTAPVVLGVCGENGNLKLMLDLAALVKDAPRA